MKKTIPFVLTLIGIVAFCFLTAKAGIHPILTALGKVGPQGFLLTVAAQLGVNILLGVAWKSSVPTIGLLRLTAARLVRDAATACLPFSQLGGLLIGLRATTAGTGPRPDWPESVAANIVDITTEVLAQIAFIVFALLCLVGEQDAGRFIWPLAIGMAILCLLMAGFVWTQQSGGSALTQAATFLARHIAADWQKTVVKSTDNFQAALDALWRRPAFIAMGAFLHLICWFGNVAITWFCLWLLDTPLTFFDTVALEGVVCGVLTAGFLVPGSLGVQEGAYLGLGLLLGLGADVSLSLSLLRRGRDILIGVPVLLLWQFFEIHIFRHAQKTRPNS